MLEIKTSLYNISHLNSQDDEQLAVIIRGNLEHFHLDIPGTAYFDPELSHLSKFYEPYPKTRVYLVIKTDDGVLLGGGGLAEFPQIQGACELQKLYLSDEAKGQGLGKKILEAIITEAIRLGYTQMYLETHSSLQAAIGLYEKYGFKELERPSWVFHSAMDRFFIKELDKQ